MPSPRRWILGLLALVGLGAAAPVLAYAQPGLVGDDEARIVLTGSMEPAIQPGDVVFLDHDVTVDDVQIGDVVTFRAHAQAQTTYTHRVVDVRENTAGTVLVTKGDANEDPDPMNVDDEMLVGVVDHQLPVYGKAITTAESLPLPLVLVALSLLTVTHEVATLRRDDEDAPSETTESETRFEVVG